MGGAVLAGGSILIVEDDPDDAFFMVRALQREHPEVEVEVCPDPVEALGRLLDASRLLPTVVFLDLQMPRMRGHEVLRELRSVDRTRYLPVVIVSGSRLEADVVGSYGVGANSHVRKPLFFDELAQKLGSAARYWVGLNSVPGPEPQPPTA